MLRLYVCVHMRGEPTPRYASLLIAALATFAALAATLAATLAAVLAATFTILADLTIIKRIRCIRRTNQ